LESDLGSDLGGSLGFLSPRGGVLFRSRFLTGDCLLLLISRDRELELERDLELRLDLDLDLDELELFFLFFYDLFLRPPRGGERDLEERDEDDGERPLLREDITKI